MRDLHSWKRLSGWQKGLLVAANDAQLCVYNTRSLSEDEVYQIRDSIRTASEKLHYHRALHAERDVWGEVSNVQTLYLQLRELLATLRGFFLLFKQHQFFADLLNDALCRKGKAVSTVRDCVLSDHHNIIGGELELRTENKAPPYFKISVSDDLEKDVYELASTVSANMRDLKGEVERARRLVRHSPVNLQPYEQYLDGIESEVRDLIRRTKCQLYNVDSDRWPQMREGLAKIDDELVNFVEALPDYYALRIETVTIYQTEKDGLLVFFVTPELNNLDNFVEKVREEDKNYRTLRSAKKIQKKTRFDSNALPISSSGSPPVIAYPEVPFEKKPNSCAYPIFSNLSICGIIISLNCIASFGSVSDI